MVKYWKKVFKIYNSDDNSLLYKKYIFTWSKRFTLNSRKQLFNFHFNFRTQQYFIKIPIQLEIMYITFFPLRLINYTRTQTTKYHHNSTSHHPARFLPVQWKTKKKKKNIHRLIKSLLRIFTTNRGGRKFLWPGIERTLALASIFFSARLA